VADSERIFEKFYRGSVHRASTEGTGLGLAIARSIAEVHGGSLWLDHEAAGPAFRFLLPSTSLEDIAQSEQLDIADSADSDQAESDSASADSGLVESILRK
jgi:signal transduction histidine kinase